MNPRPSLPQNVHQLIRVHLTHDHNGKVTKQLALIDQLADAVHNSTASRSGGSNTPGLPLNSDAIDRDREIKLRAMREEYQRTGEPEGGIRVILKQWSLEERPEWVAQLATTTQWMIDQITGLISPEPPRRPLRQPCPACDTEWVSNQAGDRKSCLTARVYSPEGGVLPTDEWDIGCAQCGAQWTATDPAFKYVLGVLNQAA